MVVETCAPRAMTGNQKAAGHARMGADKSVHKLYSGARGAVSTTMAAPVGRGLRNVGNTANGSKTTQTGRGMNDPRPPTRGDTVISTRKATDDG